MAIAPDSRFICSSDVDSYYNDKLTGLPLSAGIVKFYSDIDKTTPKAVYQLTGDGSSGNPYAFSSIGNQVTLNSVGSYAYGGNNIALYYFPFFCTTNGDPTTASTTQELYYITVENSGNISQFTRNAWPPLAANLTPSNNSDTGIKNYIPNGQFLSHNDGSAAITAAMGSEDATQIAQGGWYFKKTTGGTGAYTISFNSEIAGASGLEDFPPYSVNIACTAFGTETVHDLVMQWPDVNTFSTVLSAGETNKFNLLFAAKLNSGSSAVFSVRLISNFGSGGSTEVSTAIQNVTVTTSWQYFNINIPMPDNLGKTIGSGNYVAVVVRTPAAVVDVRLTDFAFTLGEASLPHFPVMTPDEMLSRGVAGYMPTPNPNGNDLYLPLVLTSKGMAFDDSSIGKVEGHTNGSPGGNLLLCDGSEYITANYSSLGIPYARLKNKIFNSTPNAPIWGTGASLVNVQISSGATSTLILCANQAGANSNPADGTVATNFTFGTSLNINAGTSGYSYNAHSNNTGIMVMWSNFTSGTLGGALLAAGTSGITALQSYTDGLGSSLYGANLLARTGAQFGNGAGAGKYFTFSDSAVNYYAWFKTATETDPAPGGTGIQINLLLTMTAVDTANIIACVLSGKQTNTITCGAASTFNTGAYFTFKTVTSTKTYVVWYNKASGGGQPTVVGATDYIQVNLPLGTETAPQVALATQGAINSYSFAVPDLRGMFLRGTDTSMIFDIGSGQRWTNINNGSIGVGSFEYYHNVTHIHTATSTTTIGGSTSAAVGAFVSRSDTNNATLSPTTTTTIAADGNTETVPLNMAVNWYMRY